MPADAIKTVTLDTGTVSRSASRKAASITEAYNAHNSPRITNAPAAKGDRLELSERGRLLSEASGLAKKLERLPDVRPQTIERAERMMESGELFSKDAIRRAAERLRRFLEHQGG